MKKLILLFITLFLITSCKNDVIEKPKNLISKDKMENIIYDLALLEAAKGQDAAMQIKFPKPSDFIKAKYKVDSLTFAKSTQYYASDIKEYKKMYANIKARLEVENKKYKDTLKVIEPLEQGIVK
jgi:hypothetical protein